MKKTTITLISFLAIISSSCNRDKPKRDERLFDVNVTMEKNDFVNVENTRKAFNAHSGDYFSSIDSVTQYGAGYVKKIDDSLRGYNVDIVVSAYIREASAPLEGGLAVSVFAPTGIKDWRVLQPKVGAFKPGQWNLVQDTVKYPSSLLTEKDSEIKIFSVKPKGSDFLDIDDIKIKYIFYK
jgi:hypothetical protein